MACFDYLGHRLFSALFSSKDSKNSKAPYRTSDKDSPQSDKISPELLIDHTTAIRIAEVLSGSTVVADLPEILLSSKDDPVLHS